MAILDSIVIQVTEKAYGEGGAERLIAQESSDYTIDPPVINPQKMIKVVDLPGAEKAMYDGLKAYLETQLNL